MNIVWKFSKVCHTTEEDPNDELKLWTSLSPFQHTPLSCDLNPADIPMHGSIQSVRAHLCELSSHQCIGGLLLQFSPPLASSRYSVIIAGLKQPSHEDLANPVLIQQGEEWYAIRAWWASGCIPGVCAELANTKYVNGERMAHQWHLQPFLPVGFKLLCDLFFLYP